MKREEFFLFCFHKIDKMDNQEGVYNLYNLE